MAGPPDGDKDTPDRLIYREDEGHFKRRLDSSIQFYWVYNSAMTILVCVLIFYFLKVSIFISIVVALLILLVSNIQLTLSRVGQAARWRVSTNSVVIPSRRRGWPTSIQFSDISSIERRRGPLGESVVLHMEDGRRISFSRAGQEKPISALMEAFSRYKAVRGRRAEGVAHPGEHPLLIHDTPEDAR
jgi:hypothetical protein